VLPQHTRLHQSEDQCFSSCFLLCRSSVSDSSGSVITRDMIRAPIMADSAVAARALAVLGFNPTYRLARISMIFRNPSVAILRVCSLLRASSLPMLANGHPSAGWYPVARPLPGA
jgi:hypothetical protein